MLRWSWRDQQLAQNVYIETIRSANRSYQRAVNMLGVVAVNHLVSLVDAYVNVVMDWDQSGTWGGVVQCPLGPAPEWKKGTSPILRKNVSGILDLSSRFPVG